jgi:hypothetical protein
MNRSIEMLEIVAAGLGALRGGVVFVGGSTVILYSEDPAAGVVRPTDDVDCVVEAVTRTKYHELEGKLRELGFQHVISQNAPLCRWTYEGVQVDVMPSDPQILGFANPWYDHALSRSQIVVLSNGLPIHILRPEYFLATKLEARKRRSGEDIRLSADLEDIIFLVDSRPGLVSEVRQAAPDVRRFISREVGVLRNDPLWNEALLAIIGISMPSETRERIDASFRDLVALAEREGEAN